MNLLFAISVVITFAYLIVCLFLSRGLRKIDTREKVDITSDVSKLRVAVVVAARNEEKNISALLESLKNQTYPSHLFSVTVVDDRSIDTTSKIVADYRSLMSNLSLLTVESVPIGISPKKNAITQGISCTDSDIILVTDADCTVPAHWISEVVSRFADNRIGLVQGLTLYPRRTGLFHRFQRLDFFSHSVVAAAGIGSGIPINSNANNFAYRRKLFEDLNGFEGCEHIVSGDDDLLLQKVWEQGTWGISYLFTPNAAVMTLPTENFVDFFEQRKRWGSKTVFYKKQQLFVLAIIFLFYCLVALNSILLFTPLGNLILVIALYSAKSIGELLFLLPGTAVFRTTEMRKDILWGSFFQLWVVLLSVFGGVLGGFSWKGTSFRKTVKKN